MSLDVNGEQPAAVVDLLSRGMLMGLARSTRGQVAVTEEPGAAVVNHVARCERRAARGCHGLAVKQVNLQGSNPVHLHILT